MYKIEQPIRVKRNEIKRTVKRRIEQEANDYYQQEAKEIKKLRDLNKYKRNVKREKYIGELNWKDARTIFKIRTRTTKIAETFKGIMCCMYTVYHYTVNIHKIVWPQMNHIDLI